MSDSINIRINKIKNKKRAMKTALIRNIRIKVASNFVQPQDRMICRLLFYVKCEPYTTF